MELLGTSLRNLAEFFVARGLATPGGIEPPTNSLEGCCSIQLSYGATARDRIISRQIKASRIRNAANRE